MKLQYGFIPNSHSKIRKRKCFFVGITRACGALLMCLWIFSSVVWAKANDGADTHVPSDQILAELATQVATIWGQNNVWIPTPTVWVQYEPDLGERSVVDFEKGTARVQILLGAKDDPHHDMVINHLCQGVGNLIQAEAQDRLAMTNNQGLVNTQGTTAQTHPARQEVRVYIVRRGDSLWKIAERFGMKTTTLAKMNGLASDSILQIGRPLKVMVYASHDLTIDSNLRPAAQDPFLLDQIRMTDGRPVPQFLIKEFAREVVDKQPNKVEKVIGADGIERLAVTVEFELVSNHLEIRARKFQPLVQKYASQFDVDPALITAIIHTESKFNPYARSDTPAYGLMQLVPHTGGKEAYRHVSGRNLKPTPQYLYEPDNNIKLGAAYYSILKEKYMGSILDMNSQRYCAVAAYNAGVANVGKAFINKKSINQAIPVINNLKTDEVFSRLADSLPLRESRNYVRKVFNHVRLYENWY